MKRLFNILLVAFSLLTLSACDMDDFNSVFRSPYIVDIGSIESMEPNKWYEFSKDFEALNLLQDIEVSFAGSAPRLLYMRSIPDQNYESGYRHEYESDLYPGEKIEISILIFDESNKEYKFKASGTSGAILFSNASDEKLKGKRFKALKLKSNLNLENVEITWMSRAGK